MNFSYLVEEKKISEHKFLPVLNFRAAAFESNLGTYFRIVTKSYVWMRENFYEYGVCAVLSGNHEIFTIPKICHFYLVQDIQEWTK